MNIYYNYHKHDIYTNIRVIDTIVKPEDFMKRSVELGHKSFFTTNHGCSGNVFEAYDMCKKHNLLCIFGMELYFVYDRTEKTQNNWHIIAIALNREGYRELNYISSEANINGFYRQPRVDIDLLLALNPENVVVTTACINNPLFFKNEEHDEIKEFLLPLKKHFGNHFFLEVQSHNDVQQIDFNKEALRLSKEYDIEIIHANDSHYIYPEDKYKRSEFLKGKKFNYSFEDNFILDYPDYDTILKRYEIQGVLSRKQAISALNNTLIFDKAEDLGFTKEVKMPTIYPELSLDERLKKLQGILNKKWREYKKGICDKDELNRRKEEIHKEFKVIKDCNDKIRIADYFLINHEIIHKAVNEYGGVLTRTGRGSAVSYVINKLLGFTEIDRLEAEVPLYPSRFISSARLLESVSLPDIDFNMADDKPFIKASKEILGEHSVYRMIAYGKMKESSAFRNLCRARDLDINEYNDVAKDLDRYKEDEKWKDLIKESEQYIDVIENISPSPCSFIMLNEDIRREIGILRINGELCACIDGYTSDVWKYLKSDYLIVSVWDIIYKVFDVIGQPIPTINELRNKLDDNVWNLYRDGITATLNQVDSDFATHLVKKYAPKTPAQLTSFVAVIRPACESFRDEYLTREPYSTQVPQLDKILESTQHRLIYQENLMAYFAWLGIPEDGTYDIIKKISKKKFKHEEIEELKSKLRESWIRILGNDDYFAPTWEVVESSVQYLFNASHAYSVAYDSLYGAYLKANYPLEYYTTVLNVFSDDADKIKSIESELPYFNIKISPIKFRHSLDQYTFDKETNSIYKGVSSIKYLNKKISKELYKLRDNHHDTFVDLLIDITKTSVNSRQLDILIKLDFFSEFGDTEELLAKVEIFNQWYDRKQINKEDASLPHETMMQFCEQETDKLYKGLYTIGIINHLYNTTKFPKTSIRNKIDYQLEFLGYVQTTIPSLDSTYAYVVDVNSKYKNRVITLYRLNTGETEAVKVKAKQFEENPISKGDIIKTIESSEEKRWKRDSEGGYYQIDELETILRKWSFAN